MLHIKSFILMTFFVFLNIFWPSNGLCLSKNNVSTSELLPQVCQILYISVKGEVQGSCSGTVIHPDYILSAKHCEYLIRDQNTKTVSAVCPGTQNQIISQSILLETEEEERSRSYRDDLVIHQLAKSSDIKPVKILQQPSYDQLENMECQLQGYGGGKLNGMRFSYSPSDISNPQFSLNIPDETIVEGDSGGAYFCREKNGSWMLVGVINQIIHGHDFAESLYRHLDWIKETIEK